MTHKTVIITYKNRITIVCEEKTSYIPLNNQHIKDLRIDDVKNKKKYRQRQQLNDIILAKSNW